MFETLPAKGCVTNQAHNTCLEKFRCLHSTRDSDDAIKFQLCVAKTKSAEEDYRLQGLRMRRHLEEQRMVQYDRLSATTAVDNAQ